MTRNNILAALALVVIFAASVAWFVILWVLA